MRILIVDDNELNREIAESIVESLGADPLLAESGAIAIEKVEESMKTNQPIDVVLMDYLMPEMNGDKATEAIHKLPNASDLPVIAMTAEENTDTISSLLAAGMCAVLHKPVDAMSLYNALSDFDSKELIRPMQQDSSEDTKDEKLLGLKNLEFDVDSGMKITGSSSIYKQYVYDFTRLLPGVYDTLKDCYEKGDFERFTIDVHGLKSNFKTLGHTSLFNLCRNLENCGKERDLTKLKELFENFVPECQECIDGLQKIYEKRGKKAALPYKKLKSLLRELRDAMETFDLDTADPIMEYLEAHEADAEISEDMNRLYVQVAGLRYEKAIETIDNLLSKDQLK